MCANNTNLIEFLDCKFIAISYLSYQATLLVSEVLKVLLLKFSLYVSDKRVTS